VKLAAIPAKSTITTTPSLTATVKVVALGKAKAVPGTVTFYDGAAQIGSVALTSKASAKPPVTLSAGPTASRGTTSGMPTSNRQRPPTCVPST